MLRFFAFVHIYSKFLRKREFFYSMQKDYKMGEMCCFPNLNV